MPSFGIVSKTDLQEVGGAINAARRERAGRFGFKDPGCAPERKDALISLPVGVVKKS